MITADSDGFAKSSFKIGKKKKLMPLSRPIRNLTKFTQIPHLASGMLLQDLPCLVLPCSSSSNCRNRLQSCSLCSRCRFFFFFFGAGGGGGGGGGGRRGGGGGEQKEKYRGRTRVSGEARKSARTSLQTASFAALALHPALSWFAHPSQTSGGQKRDSFSEQNNYSVRASR